MSSTGLKNWTDFQHVSDFLRILDQTVFFIVAYHQQANSENVQNCDNRDKPDENKFCEFKITNDFAPCTNEWGYGFGNKEGGGPCIFLKLNKVIKTIYFFRF